ncbi:hypothetical protein CC80DRAFT_525869 [Byssothecium circinans]|uniref:Gingipain domain-containing protein n=1 Tax=Byssothecium circinans TaxID=147558 RepID=A0A6A5TUX8_9PLEO|nr:hypothetical protein CC80DRAFT_525869 [Byssothecium circinans]
MHSFTFLLPLVALLQLCLAISSPDIYSLTQPAGESPDLGESSRSPTIPSQSRHIDGPDSGLIIFVPSYGDDPNWLPLTLSLKTVGLQVKVITTLSIPPKYQPLLIYTPPSVTYSPSTADVTALTSFVADGGVLIFMNQIPTALQKLAGVSESTVHTQGLRSAIKLANGEVNKQSLLGFDFTNAYDITMPFFDNTTATGLINVGYKPHNCSQILGNYLIRTGNVESLDTSTTNVAITKHKPTSTSGYVYCFGMDLGYLYIQAQNEGGNYAPWYDGHYYSGYDIANRMIKNIVTSSAHFVSLWSVPYNKGLAFTTTWDIDTYVSYPHGQGMAAAALERGAAGNLNLHTKYITDAYEKAYFQYGVPYIYQITGFRNGPDGYPFIDFGSHSVSHSPNAVEFPYGSRAERFIQGTTSGYAPSVYQCGPMPNGTPDNGQTCIQGGTSGLSFWTSGGSASGEVRVSAYLIRQLLQQSFGTNYNLTTYRPGNLAWNRYQATHCVANGIIGGSSCAANFHLTHLPFQVLHNRESFAELPYYEFPLQWSDGDGNMSSADFPGSDFRMQVDDMKLMARYGGHYNLLIHPSDAVLDKIQIQRAFHDAVRPFAVFFNQTGIANWWTIRDRAVATITAASNTSVTMTVRLDGPAEGLTLQVPRTYAFESTSGDLSVCQQLSYDKQTNAIVLRNTAQGLFTLNFGVGTPSASQSTCPNFTPQPLKECIAWDVSIDDFLDLYFYNRGINLLLLQTVASGLSTNNVDGRLQLVASTNTGINSYYTEISRFCFDATNYTHVYFDMVAPAGSKFYVELVTYDASCQNAVASETYLDVTDYAAADGRNHTVTIPISDFRSVDLTHVRGIRIGNISPAQTPIYIDNIKLQKRCHTAPGEDRTRGLAIESFQNVDRWITGINNIFGQTDTDNSMTFAKLSELGRMQLLPSSATSHIYTSTVVNGVKLDASTYTDISISVRGPTDGSFDIVLTSGTSNTNATINTSAQALLSQTAFSTVRIPLASFSGLDKAAISRITLQNFTPNGGSAASNFTVRWISLLGGPVPGATGQCKRASGYVVLDFCDPNEFALQKNALDAPFSDDNTMATYSENVNGSVNLVPTNAASYFYTLFTPTPGCATVNGTYDAIQLAVSGPPGATADVGFRYGTTSCTGGVTTSYVPITFSGAMAQITIPFSRFPSSFNQNNIQSFSMTNFSAPGSTYNVYSLTFVGPANSAGCGRCSGTLVNTCTFTSAVPTANKLLGAMSDDASLTTYTTQNDGSLSFGTNAGAYWYTNLGSALCYNANTVNATGIELSVAAPPGTTFAVALRWSTDVACTTSSPATTVAITDYLTFAGSTNYQLAQIPFSAFPGVDTNRIRSIALAGFNPADVDVKLGCVSLASFAVAPPASTCTCPAYAWLNYCITGVADRNALGNVQSDDGTMRTPPALNDGALELKPAAAGDSYWYSNLNCLDASASTTLYLNVTAPAGTSFNIELQSKGSACGNPGVIRAAVVSSSYAAMTGSSVIDGTFSLTTLFSVAIITFTDNSATYSLNCAYFGTT